MIQRGSNGVAERLEVLRNLPDEEKIRLLVLSSSWVVFARNFSIPKFFRISCDYLSSGIYESVIASKIFEFMKLDLKILSQIFVVKPWDYYAVPPGKRQGQPTKENYEDLGTCRAWDDDGWSALARFTGKKIELIHAFGDPEENYKKATFFPDGRVVECVPLRINEN